MKNQEIDQFPVIQQEASALEQHINKLAVTDDKTLAEASDIVKAAKDLYKKLDADKKRFTKPANEIISAAKAKYDPLLKALKGFEDTLKQRSSAYLIERQKIADDKIAKLGARVEKGTMREDTARAKMDDIDTSKDVHTGSSGMRMQMRRDVEVTPIEQIGDANILDLCRGGYLVLDMVKIRKDALAGIEIPGVKIIEKPVMQSV